MRKPKAAYPVLELWMQRNHISQVRLAKLLDYTHVTIRSWLRGNTKPPLSVCRCLVELTGIPFEELFAKEIPPSRWREIGGK